MKVLPAADGWSTWNVLPAVYAEFNSMTASGGIVDLSNRRSRYTTATDTTDLAPLLTREQADSYSIDNVLGGADAWQPRLFTEQAPAPVIALTDTALTWDDNEYVLGWAVIRNGVFIDFITNNYYTIPEGVTSGVYTVRAANAMGGLGEASNAINLNATGITDALFPLEVKVFPNPTRQTVTVQLPETASKANIRLMGMDGRLLLQADMNQSSMELDLNAVAPGLYLLVINSAGQNAVQKIVKQ